MQPVDRPGRLVLEPSDVVHDDIHSEALRAYDWLTAECPVAAGAVVRAVCREWLTSV
jgi:hypothetical protein